MAQNILQALPTPMYFILLSVLSPKQGHQLRKSIEEISQGNVRIGAGTIYVLLARCEAEFLIRCTSNVDGKKEYLITRDGIEILNKELDRLHLLYTVGSTLLNDRI